MAEGVGGGGVGGGGPKQIEKTRRNVISGDGGREVLDGDLAKACPMFLSVCTLDVSADSVWGSAAWWHLFCYRVVVVVVVVWGEREFEFRNGAQRKRETGFGRVG